MNVVRFLTFSVIPIITLTTPVLSQVKTFSEKLEWHKPLDIRIDESTINKVLHFSGATYDELQLPVFYKTYEMPAASTSFEAEIFNELYETVEYSDIIFNKENISNQIKIYYSIGYKNKKPIACINILPLRKNNSGKLEQLVSFDLKINSLVGNSLRSTSRTYASNSVLASGDWYKFGIPSTGIFKLSYQNLKAAGINIDNVDPRTIQLYGNGGGQLAYLNSVPRTDDLAENSIYVSGESDGIFNETDYILFYGKGQSGWKFSSGSNPYYHSVNNYSDTAYYFLTFGQGPGKRILSRASIQQSPDFFINSFDDYFFHENDLVNHLKSGRQWYGEIFDNLRPQFTLSHTFFNLVTTEPVYFNSQVVGRSVLDSTFFRLFANGTQVASNSASKTSTAVTANYAEPAMLTGSATMNSPSINLSINFSSTDASAVGWLNYVEMVGRRWLNFSGSASQMAFRDSRSVGNNTVGQYTITGTVPDFKIWDVTKPTEAEEQLASFQNGETQFIFKTDSLREYIGFTGSNFLSPVFAGKIENQNLHALQQAQLLIVVNPKFLVDANRLAQFHRDRYGYTVNVVTTSQVFNEFSSGSQDVSAIRDFVKMFYDRSTGPSDSPRFLTLFGDGSYDNKFRLNNNTNYVTTYQSDASLNQTTTYISDDFFALLDDNEGEWLPSSNNEIVDISVGRLPVKSEAEAKAVVNKIIIYGSKDPGNQNQPNSAYGDWRNIISFVADDQDVNTHFNQSEILANKVNTDYPVYNIDKIYLDAYNQESTPGGQRYPEARQAIFNRVQRGTLLLTYIGHGGEVGWAHERVLEIDDINNWSNLKHCAAFLTATCEFSRPDDPARNSAGELVLLNQNGGGICLFTTTRLAFSGSNFSLAQKFYNHFFNPVNGTMPTAGEVFQRTKADYNDRYVRNFVLLGDPALRLSYPEQNVVTTAVNNQTQSSLYDTLKALSKITVTGEVKDQQGNKLTSFNGIVYPTVFDKTVTVSTLGNDLGWNGEGGSSYPANFNLQKNILYKGKVQAANGDFTFSFVVPKDISYQYGAGKISYYASDGNTDGNGFTNSIIIGGLNANAISDQQGPDIRLFMNDEKFIYGGITDENPFIYALVSDSAGINTVGNGIGHDITGIIDEDNTKLVVLNDYYEADLDQYQSGKIYYQLKNLKEGKHTVNLKVWDVYNNSSEAKTEFIVASGAEVALSHVLNYPNPFTTNTTFMFEHNKPFTELDVQIQIFTVSGKLIKTIDQLVNTEGYRSNEIRWNGLDDFGDRIGKGVYLYKLKVKTPSGSYAQKFEKLVILK